MKSTRQEAIRLFEATLLDFFKKAGRSHLPWRRKGMCAYEVWVSEIMLQQTQVSRVLSYYEKFLKRFPTVVSLSQASWEEFLPFYAGLGYYARGRNMLRAAKVVAEKYKGVFPQDTASLEALPGIGKYTAAAIASFASGANTLAWDTNLRRVVGRFFFGTKHIDPSSSEFSRFFAPHAKRFSGAKKEGENSEVSHHKNPFSIPANVANAALMDFGSAICVSKPKCAACPFVRRCVYFRTKGRREMEMQLLSKKGKRANIFQGASRNGNSKLDFRTSMSEAHEAEVTLHENHRIYFSSVKKTYRPFRIPSSYRFRAGIKRWFLERYGLEVSVRPPHGFVMRAGLPTLLVNAQILLGKPLFRSFSKEEVRRLSESSS